MSITYGTVNGAPITGSPTSSSFMSKRTVTLGANAYNRTPPAGYPNPGAGEALSSGTTNYYAFPQTIPGGTQLTLFLDEAAALIAASAAS